MRELWIREGEKHIMGRDMDTTPVDARGSQKWLQMLVNACPGLLGEQILCKISPVANEIRWRSPLEDDGYAEYKDGDFIDRLGIRLDKRPLESFWPSSGPRWDGLGVTDNGQVLLLEAKAHVGERGSGLRAKRPRSRELIYSSLSETKAFMDVPKEVDWTKRFYQYANRLAHLYLLHALNGIDAYLVYVYFSGDGDMQATGATVPRTDREWKPAVLEVETALGLHSDHKLSGRVVKVFIDVEDIERRTSR